MTWKLTLSDGKKDVLLPEDIDLDDGVNIDYLLSVSSAGGKCKFRRAERCEPITLVLTQPLGHDTTLFDLFKNKGAGFKLKLTLAVMEDGGENDKPVDILDINLTELIPGKFRINSHLVLEISTMTTPEVKWLKPKPERITTRKAS
jgi:hypothetical protein